MINEASSAENTSRFMIEKCVAVPLKKTRYAYFLLGPSSLQVVVAKDLQTEPKRRCLALVVTFDSCRVLGL